MSKNTNTRYHPLQVSLHWLVVLLILATFLLGKYMSGLPNDSAKIPFLGFHMALGLITLSVIVVRFIARLRLARPVSVTTGNAFLDWVGKAVHGALYLLVFLMALSGMSLSLQSGLLPAVFGTSGASIPADFYEFSARTLHGFIGPVSPVRTQG
jgi:cytochrome b561